MLADAAAGWDQEYLRRRNIRRNPTPATMVAPIVSGTATGSGMFICCTWGMGSLCRISGSSAWALADPQSRKEVANKNAEADTVMDGGMGKMIAPPVPFRQTNLRTQSLG